MVIVNVHVCDFLIHLAKSIFFLWDISFEYLVKLKKKHLTRAFKKKGVFKKKTGGLGFF